MALSPALRSACWGGGGAEQCGDEEGVIIYGALDSLQGGG